MASYIGQPQVLLYLRDYVPTRDTLTRGVAAYCQDTPSFDLAFRGNVAQNLDEEIKLVRRLAGIICRVENPADIKVLKKTKIPVMLIEQDSLFDLPVVRADNFAIGEMAYKYFAAKGYRNFAFWGSPPHLYSEMREKAFLGSAEKAGHTIFPGPRSQYHGPTKMRTLVLPDAMNEWVAKLPRPLALLVDTSCHARQLLAACQDVGMHFPEDVAVLAGDNDEVHCNTGKPTLSGIDQRFFEVGYRAAEWMQKILSGQAPQVGTITIPPACVVERQSTDAMAIDDPDLAAALNYIRLYATRASVSAPKLANHIAISVRSLHLLFRRKLGRSVHDEITRVRIEHAKRLLLTTNMGLMEVAFNSGYTGATVFGRAFRRHTRITPLQFRQNQKRPRR